MLTTLTLRHLFQNLPFKALPRLEQLGLAAHALNVPRSWVLAHDTDALTPIDYVAVTDVLQRRLHGEPVAYIVGYREFYGLNFAVSPAVLIPRPDTELLVDWLIQHTPRHGKVLDLGTGSGAIAVAFAVHRPDCTILACDVSATALAIAKSNIDTHCPCLDPALPRVNTLLSDWCAVFYQALPLPLPLSLVPLVPLPAYQAYFDVVVSNPPYIAADDVHLQQGDLRYEPCTALTDGGDGLRHYQTIAAQALPLLKPSGALVLEHGWQQQTALIALLQNTQYQKVQGFADAALHGELGAARMVVAYAPHGLLT